MSGKRTKSVSVSKQGLRIAHQQIVELRPSGTDEVTTVGHLVLWLYLVSKLVGNKAWVASKPIAVGDHVR
jgi:hypothetical protein